MDEEIIPPPKISVVMTTLQSDLFIRDAIQSILNQTFKNYELIIVDGGSTDKTTDIVEEMNAINFIKHFIQRSIFFI